MNRICTILAVVVAVIAMGLITAGKASAYIDCTPILPNAFVTESWTNDVSNDVTYVGVWTSAGPSARLWNPGGGNRAFAGTNFTLTENATVTLKVNQYDVGVNHTVYSLSDLTFYLYAGGFNKSTPLVNRMSVEGVNLWDGADKLTLDLETGTAYTFVISTDLAGPQTPTGQQWVTAEITASAVPIPGAVLLFGSGLVGLAGLKHRLKY